jgi:hypothetical protein
MLERRKVLQEKINNGWRIFDDDDAVDNDDNDE